MISILLALPCYGGIMAARTAVSLVNLCKEFQNIGIPHEILIVSNQSLIPKGRSDIANYFVNATNFSHLMWIDSDIVFQPEDVFKLMELQVPHAMATYRHKVQHPKYSFTLQTDNEKIVWNENKTACKVLKNVGGFSLIHRDVFEKVKQSGQAKKYIPWTDSRTLVQAEIENSYHYYDIEISKEDGSILPEDFAFHEKCINAGMDLWLRTDIQLIHNGNTDFVGTDIHSILRSQ